jgi:PAS domain-containing protein
MGYDASQSSRPPAGLVLGEPADRAQGLLETEYARFLEVIEKLRVGYVLTKPRGAIVLANSTAAAMLGCSALADKLLIAFVARRDTRTFRAALLELATHRRWDTTFQVRLRQRGGPVFLAQLAAQAIRLAPGRTAFLRWTIEAT